MESCQENLQDLTFSIRFLLLTLLQANNGETSIASVGQAIMLDTFPTLILVPLQLGLGVQIHQLFGSKFLIESLYSQGFSLPYAEILLFEKMCGCIPGYKYSRSGQASKLLMYAVTDNVDQNAKTMDGKNAFHGMGVIVVVAPCLKSIYFIFLIYFVVWNIDMILSFQRCLLSLNNFSVC